jgi:hypothetical protein
MAQIVRFLPRRYKLSALIRLQFRAAAPATRAAKAGQKKPGMPTAYRALSIPANR